MRSIVVSEAGRSVASSRTSGRRLFALGIAAALLFAGSLAVAPTLSAIDMNTGAGATASTAAPADAIDFDDILTAFATGQKTVNVIVSLRSSKDLMTMTNFNVASSAKGLRQQMASLQASVLSNYAAGELTVRRRYENLPGFSAAVTIDGYQKLLGDSMVEAVAPVRTVEANLKQGIPLIHGDVYRSQYSGANVSVAIIDSGIDYTHPQLGGGGFPNGKVIGGYDFVNSDNDPRDQYGHGTSVAGIAAGDSPTSAAVGDYIGGVVPDAKLYGLRVLNAGGSGSTDDVIAGLDWCVTHKNDNTTHPIVVANMSLGIAGLGFKDADTCAIADPLFTVAVDTAMVSGITVVASSGNDGFTDKIGFPACLPNVISVGAVYDATFPSSHNCPKDTPIADTVICYSDTASFLSVLAPSENAYTLDMVGPAGNTSGDYDPFFDGTSAASPYAAGSAAAIQSAALTINKRPLSVSLVRRLLVETGDSVTDDRPTVPIIKPRVNLAAAITNIANIPPLPDLLPPVMDQGATINGKSYAPPTFQVAYGFSVPWAMGYYCMTFLQATQQRLNSDDLVNPIRQMSPYFLFNNGGSDYFNMCGELLKGWGVPSVLQYPSYSKVTEPADLTDAANHKLLDMQPFFYHRPVVDSETGDFLGGSWDNDVQALSDWLDQGGAFVIGIPVYQSFEDYAPSGDITDVRDLIYKRGKAKDDPLVGFHALCVIGQIKGVHAFKAVNSWGDKWGVNPFTGVSEPLTGSTTYVPRGYVWLSYEFVRKQAIEAWRLRIPAPLDITTCLDVRSDRQITETTDYVITYKGPGDLEWTDANFPFAGCTTATVLIVRGGGSDDTLSIRRRPGVKAGETIPVVTTDGSFARIYTEATIGALRVQGNLAKLIAQGCVVEKVVTTGTVQTIRMTAKPNSSWDEVASRHYQDDIIRTTTGKTFPEQGIDNFLHNFLYTEIDSLNANMSSSDARVSASIRLSGVILRRLLAPQQSFGAIKTTSKAYPLSRPGFPRFLSYGGIDDTYDPFYGDIKEQGSTGNPKTKVVQPVATDGSTSGPIRRLGTPVGNWENQPLSSLADISTRTRAGVFPIRVTPLFTNIKVDCLMESGDVDLRLGNSGLGILPASTWSSDGHKYLEYNVKEGGVYYIGVYPNATSPETLYDLQWNDDVVPSVDFLRMFVKNNNRIAAESIQSIRAWGGAIQPAAIDTMSFLGSVSATGYGFSTTFDKKKIFIPYHSDVAPDILLAPSPHLSIVSHGGDVKGEQIVAGGEISSVEARLKRYMVNHFDPKTAGDAAWTSSSFFRGGVVGWSPKPTSLAVPELMHIVSGAKEIPPLDMTAKSYDAVKIHGVLAVFGRFAARPMEVADKPDIVQTGASVKRIQTRRYWSYPPLKYKELWWYRIQGSGYSVEPIKLITEDSTQFQQFLATMR